MFGFSCSGATNIKGMYEIELAEGHRLVDTIRRDTASSEAKSQQAEYDVRMKRSQYNDVASAQNIHRKEILEIQQKITENDRVSQIHHIHRRTRHTYKRRRARSTMACTMIRYVLALANHFVSSSHERHQ
jgi:hypothetical protein